MSNTRSDIELDRLYRHAANEFAPASIDAPVFAAAQSRARRVRWARRSMVLLPLAAAAFVLWPTARLKQPVTSRVTTSTAVLLREELMRVGTAKPAMASDVANWLVDASPYVEPSDPDEAPIVEENSP